MRAAQAVAVIGPVASGKSTVCRGLSAEVSWPVISFGAYVRDMARRQIVSPGDRAALERVGAELIAARGDRRFLRDVIAWHGHTESAVLDGIRHPEILRELNRFYARTASFYLDAPDEVRYRRWLAREGLDDNAGSLAAFQRMSGDQVERHVFRLRREADFTIDAIRPPGAIVAEIRSRLDPG